MGEFSCTFPALRCKSLIINGAGEWNRTPSQDCEAHLNRSQFALWTARRFHPATSAAFAGDMVFASEADKAISDYDKEMVNDNHFFPLATIIICQ